MTLTTKEVAEAYIGSREVGIDFKGNAASDFFEWLSSVKDELRQQIALEVACVPYWSNGVGDGFDVGFGAEPDLSITPTRTYVIEAVKNAEYADEARYRIDAERERGKRDA